MQLQMIKGIAPKKRGCDIRSLRFKRVGESLPNLQTMLARHTAHIRIHRRPQRVSVLRRNPIARRYSSVADGEFVYVRTFFSVLSTPQF